MVGSVVILYWGPAAENDFSANFGFTEHLRNQFKLT